MIAASAVAGGVWAQSAAEIPKPVGIPAGPVVIAPTMTVGYAYNSNVFLNTESLSPSPDQVLTLEPSVALTVPFSNSSFRIGDTLTWVDYKETPQVAGKTSNDAEADLTLNFGSLDTLEISAHNISGVAETLAFDPGGEVGFRGNSYRLATESVAASRDVPNARGYRFGLRRNALKFDQTLEITFFDFRGFEGEAAYVQPLSQYTRLSFGYLGSRYDHYDISPGSDPAAVYRTEAGDAFYVQVDGQLGPKQPYSARIGWERLDFTGNAAKNFSGVIGEAKLSAIVGGGTTFTVTALRQPYRSFFEDNNFYLVNILGARVDRRFPTGSAIGGDFSFTRADYGEPSPPGSLAPGLLRRDRTIVLEAYANLAIREHVFLRLSINKNRKYSNFPGADWDALVVFGGFVFGWI